MGWPVILGVIASDRHADDRRSTNAPRSRRQSGALVFLLRRAHARVLEQTALTSLCHDGSVWVTNDEFRAPLLIGAGGHFCPVARRLRDHVALPHPVVAKEAEFRLDARGTTVVSNMPELFFTRHVVLDRWFLRSHGAMGK